ncbi:hypothetical protein AAHB37_09620 [Glutamicibacter halophytocola]|uniref:hypothetical protein n=1 Tax=Glutamicibacter halophytocola TaxID=1933880 RepID=UPI00321913C1
MTGISESASCCGVNREYARASPYSRGGAKKILCGFAAIPDGGQSIFQLLDALRIFQVMEQHGKPEVLRPTAVARRVLLDDVLRFCRGQEVSLE